MILNCDIGINIFFFKCNCRNFIMYCVTRSTPLYGGIVIIEQINYYYYYYYYYYWDHEMAEMLWKGFLNKNLIFS